MYQPRPYQAPALRAIVKARTSGHKRTLVVMASGLGKTVVAGFDIRRFMRANPGTKVLYLCHQNDILRQARTELTENILPKKYSHGFMIGDERDIHGVDVLYASFQTMHRHKTLFRRNEFDYIVVDESHHGPALTYLPTLEYFTPKFLLAITATPARMDQQDITEIYGQAVFSIELEEAWARGLLTPVDYRVITDEWQNLKILETPIGKLSVKQLNKTLFVPKRDEEIVRLIEEKLVDIEDPRVVIFSPRVEHAEQIADLMTGAFALHSRLSTRVQSERLTSFRKGEFRAVSTVDMFNEGINVPEANVIVFLRSTASRTIFFQQLGRGLRLSEGKKQVLVLDFVANCDRLVMLEELRRGVNEKLTQLRSNFSENPLVVNTGEFEFSEVVHDVLSVVRNIRTGYSRTILVKQLQTLALNLSRIPTTADIIDASKKGVCASPATLNAYFGGIIPALYAAGLSERSDFYYNKNQIIEQLQRLTKVIGRTPTQDDIRTAHDRGAIASISTICKEFGTYNKALKYANLPLNHYIGYSKEQIIEQLQRLNQALGRVPTNEDIVQFSKRGKVASKSTIGVLFGGLQNACFQAGIAPSQLTKQQAIDSIRELSIKLNRTPTQRDLNAAVKVGSCPSADTLKRLFGTHNDVMKAASLRFTPQRNYQKADIIADLQKLAKKLGQTPSQRDIKEASKAKECVSASTVSRVFGSLSQALAEAGLPLNRQYGFTQLDDVKNYLS
jgi:superfamily II DNA or RNA helicase